MTGARPRSPGAAARDGVLRAPDHTPGGVTVTVMEERLR